MFKPINPTSISKTQFRSEYSRILSAAVVNTSFRSMLLRDPAKTVSSGYSGEKFNLGYEETRRLSGIHASTLEDFAAQIARL